MRKIIEQCPSCESPLTVTELTCTTCETVVRGSFQPSIFDALSAGDLRFVEAFVLNKGNIKEMERELSVSYWSIRNRLNEVVEALSEQYVTQPAGQAKSDADLERARSEILAELAAGTVDVADAAVRLEALN